MCIGDRLRALLSYRAKRAHVEHVEQERNVPCPQCNKMLASMRAMAAHRKWTHRYTHPWRDMVTSNVCPACGVELASTESAKNHLQQKRCAASKTAAFAARVEQFAEQQRQQQEADEQ